MNVNALPDGVLTEVFALLPARDVLLAVRGVCRRFRALALHRNVCRALRVSSDDPVGVTCVALCLAPCLLFLELTPSFLQREDLVQLAYSTHCAVAELSLLTCVATGLRAVHVLVRQVALGQLRAVRYDRLHLSLEAEKMFAAIWGAELQVLDVASDYFDVSVSWKASLPLPSKASLRILTYTPYFTFNEEEILHEPHLPLLLEGHARTLEVVELPFERAACSDLVSVLANCPRLWQAALPAYEEMFPLLGCRNLTYLKLCFDLSDTEMYVEDLVPHCKGASHVKALRCYRGEDRLEEMEWLDGDLAMKLVAALASGGASCLEEVCLGKFKDSQSLMKLSSVLVDLPWLQALRLRRTKPPPEFLDDLTAATAPRLRLLDLGRVRCRGEQLARCFVPAVRRLVKRIPELHVVGVSVREPHVERCGCCRGLAGGHSAFSRDADGGEAKCYGFYGHASRCGSCRVSCGGVQWLHVGSE